MTSLLDAMSVDSMLVYVNEMSGEVPIDVGNGPELIVSRHSDNAGNALAALYYQQKFTSWGYTPTIQGFSAGSGENILVEIPGQVHPGRKVILCGHYDAIPGGIAAAPAADDDGSGTAAVLEAARVLAGLQFENTIVLALWDEEEQGKIGSIYYAGAAAANDDTIVGVVNMDAIAYDGNGDGLMRIHTKAVANSIAIKDTALLVNTAYGLGANIAINNPGAQYSDHASFWSEAYGAILVIEDFDNDPNPRYHTPNDRVQYFDVPYYEQLAKLSLGTLAHLAIPISGGTGVSDISGVLQPGLELWPVPTQGLLNLTLRLSDAAHGSVNVLDALGRPVRSIFEGELRAGRNAFSVDLNDLPPGGYLLVQCNDDHGHSWTARAVVMP
ncbi:MAG: M20/M25/M40 family metallo-hydrolase [Flavobacteriales bacterium]|nr:M20/M25/M40 family metallo-hydrolase [Flavobacteriales bacterium]